MKRRVTACITGAALIFAIVLAAAPRLHDYIHRAAGSDHECAATIFATGKCETAPPNILLSAPPVLTTSSSVRPQSVCVSSAIPRSLLEHAPPAAI